MSAMRTLPGKRIGPMTASATGMAQMSVGQCMPLVRHSASIWITATGMQRPSQHESRSSTQHVQMQWSYAAEVVCRDGEGSSKRHKKDQDEEDVQPLDIDFDADISPEEMMMMQSMGIPFLFDSTQVQACPVLRSSSAVALPALASLACQLISCMRTSRQVLPEQADNLGSCQVPDQIFISTCKMSKKMQVSDMYVCLNLMGNKV